MRVSGQHHALSTFTPGERTPPVPNGQEAGWALQPVWTQRLEEKYFCICWGLNLDCLVVQSIARRYTDWATLAPLIEVEIETFNNCKSGIDQILAELIEAGSKTLCSEIPKRHTCIWYKEEFIEQWKESIAVPVS
jgi:hypothetical protein